MILLPPIELAAALFDDSSDPLLLVEQGTQCLVRGNEASGRLTGRGLDALSGIRLLEILHARNLGHLTSLKDALREAGRLTTADGFDILSALDDKIIPVELSLRPLAGTTWSLLQLRDARPRQTLESRAELAETELALLLQNVSASVWSAERDDLSSSIGVSGGLQGWHYRYLSPETERVTGWPLEFFLPGPHKFADIIHPDDRSAILSERTAFLLSPQASFSMEVRVVAPDGQARWVRSDMQATRDGQGRAIRLDGVLTDINRSKNAELSLRESQHWLTRLLETNTNGILILDLAGRISFVNPTAEKIIGRPLEDVLDRDWNELPWQTELEGADTNPLSNIAFRTLTSSELSLVRPDGSMATLSLSAAPLRDEAGRVTGVVVTMFDLTRRKKTEEAIRRSEERYRRLFERNLAGVCRYTLDGQFLDANPAFARIFGYDNPEQMRDVPAHDLFFTNEHRTEKMSLLIANRQLTNFESRRRRKDGNEVWVLENLALVEDLPVPIIEATLIDITERKRTDQKLEDERALLLSLLHSIPDFIFFKDRDGRYRGCNPAFQIYSGLEESDIIGRKLGDLFPHDLAESLEREDDQLYATGQPARYDRVLETKLGQRFVEMVLNPMVDAQGNIIGLLGIGRDITERRRLEDQLREAGKMEAVGRLAGGVAHDFNNLLTIILGSLGLARTMLSSRPDVRDVLIESESAANRAAELTRQLLGFARRQPLAVQPLDLSQCVADTVKLLRRTIDSRIAIETRFEPHLWTAEADDGQVSQVLINLCLNARDALPEGGVIRISAGNVQIDVVDSAKNLDARPGEYVCLTIHDNGAGIAPEVRARIFEPFFTTKPFGKGTGLGLAVVFGIIRQHRGWIECSSEPGEGTRFDIFLPRSLKPAGTVSPLPDALPIASSETILLVDDEPMIRELGRITLSKQGYRVLLAEDGLVAVEAYRTHRDSIDLVILDLSMPNMSGKEALKRLRAMNPEVRVLIASGYSPDQFEEGGLEGALGYVSKPYKLPVLLAAIRTALDGHSWTGDARPSRAEMAPSSL